MSSSQQQTTLPPSSPLLPILTKDEASDDDESPELQSDADFWEIDQSPQGFSENPEQRSRQGSRAGSIATKSPKVTYHDPESVIHQQTVYTRPVDRGGIYDPYVQVKQLGTKVVPSMVHAPPLDNSAPVGNLKDEVPRSNKAVTFDPALVPDSALSTKDVLHSPPPYSPRIEEENKAVQQTVGKVQDKFQWLDEDLEEKDVIVWDKHETKCTRAWDWFNALPRLYRALLAIVVGMVILFIPGIFDIIFFVQNPSAYWGNYQPTLDASGTPQWYIGSKVLFVWSLWAAISWLIGWLLWYLIPLVPFVLTRMVLSCMGKQGDVATTQAVIEQVSLLGSYVLTSLWFLISASMFIGMMSPLTDGIDSIVFNALRNGFIVSVLWLLARLVMTRFAKNYQRMIFKARLEKNKWELYVLEHLYACVPAETKDLDGDVVLVGQSQGVEKDKMWLQGEESGAGILYGGQNGLGSVYQDTSFPHDVDPRARMEFGRQQAAMDQTMGILTTVDADLEKGLSDIPPPSATSPTAPPPKEDKFHKLAMEALNVAITGGVTAVDIPLGVPLSTLREAKLLARDLYINLSEKSRQIRLESMDFSKSLPGEVKDIHNDDIIVESFLPYFDDPRVARRAFETFDNNLDKSISRDDMKTKVVEIYNDRTALEKSMSDTLLALGRLEYFVDVILWIVTAIFFAGLFVNVGVWLAGFGAFWAGLAFAFQPTIKSIVESIIFVFVNHPFDVGDKVQFDNETFFVRELGIMSTCMTHKDGRVMYVSNSVLANKFIYNVRRSGPQSETFLLNVSVDTPNSVLVELEQKTNEMIDKRFAKDFFGDVHFWITDTSYEKGTMTLSLGIDSKTNWQSGAQRWARNTRFLRGLKRIMFQLGIQPGSLQVIHVVGLSDFYKQAITMGRAISVQQAAALTSGKSALEAFGQQQGGDGLGSL